MRQPVTWVNGLFLDRNRPAPAARGWLVACLAIGLFGCTGAPQPSGAPTVVSAATGAASATAVAQPGATPAVVTATNATPGAQASQTAPAIPAATPGPVQGLQRELALADQEMNAARTSATLRDAQQHAQAVLNILVGAWGRWYDVSQFSDPSDRRGVFPGERVPGPPKDTSSDLTPIGWGIRAYDLGDVKTQPAVQTVMGDVKLWRNDPRSRYNEIERAVTGTDLNRSLVGKLDGRSMRAVAWARLIIAKAGSLDESHQYAILGSTETSAALGAVQNLP